MTPGTLTQGRRRPDTRLGDLPDDLQIGDYWKCLSGSGVPHVVDDEPGNLTGTMWMLYVPRGGIGTLRRHTVREHEDGTISVLPNDGSSNSILQSAGLNGETWHGYIEHGVWREA